MVNGVCVSVCEFVCVCVSFYVYKTLYNFLHFLLGRPGSNIELGSRETKQRKGGTQFYACISYNSVQLFIGKRLK